MLGELCDADETREARARGLHVVDQAERGVQRIGQAHENSAAAVAGSDEQKPGCEDGAGADVLGGVEAPVEPCLQPHRPQRQVQCGLRALRDARDVPVGSVQAS